MGFRLDPCMTSPRIVIDLGKIEHNTRVIVDRLAPRGVCVTGITKAVLGLPAVGAAMLRGGASGLGDSRVENLACLSESEEQPALTLIRSPMLSQAERVVMTADASLNTEAVVLRALNEAGELRKRTHSVVLMVELGDLREGIAIDDVGAAVNLVHDLPWLHLLGLGANLACQNGVVPDDANMGVLTRLVEQTESDHQLTLDLVTAGNSANLDWVHTTGQIGRTNNLRIGEAILLGTEPLHRTAIPGLHSDAFTVIAEVIEVAEKPAQPWGTRAQGAFGNVPARTQSGTIRQAIVALGRQDADVDGLRPPEGISLLGMSSDHVVLDINDHAVQVGDEISFGLTYAALVGAMTSPFVTKLTV
jgi:predicted amino acid racemase